MLFTIIDANFLDLGVENQFPTQTQPNVDKELVIHSTPAEVEIALLEDGKLVELHNQKTNTNYAVGDIFLGKVKKLMPSLNAAFLDIGHKRNSFLHYTDLGPRLRSMLKYTDGVMSGSINTHLLDNFKIETEIIKTGTVEEVFNKRSHILVQILKEPISTKGHRLSCEVTIPGRYLVLTPFQEVVAVSKKIGNSEERKRLQTLVESVRPKNFGVIVRTAAEGKRLVDLQEELALMMEKWKNVFIQLKSAQPPAKLLSELDKTSSILRDLLSDSFNKISTDDKEMYDSIRQYLGTIAPEQVKIVNLHKNAKPIFETSGVTRQIKSTFGKTATMASGAYLVIEHTEAMHVVDVNSGHKMGGSDHEATVLNVNLEAAEEIARQMRLRDMGGIIIVDFIDMKNPEYKRQLEKAMKDHMTKDRAQHTILPLSKFGLMQITRQRVRPELTINTAELCPACHGSGKINPTVLLYDEIRRDFEFILQSKPQGQLTLEVHPYLEAYLTKGFPSLRIKWSYELKRWLRIRSSVNLSINKYLFYDESNDEIRLT